MSFFRANLIGLKADRDKKETLSEMRGRAARRFLGEMTTPTRPGESLLQFLVGIFSQNFTLRVSIVRLLKYEHLHMKYLRVTIIVLMFGFCCPHNIYFQRSSSQQNSIIKTIIVTRPFCTCGCSYFNSRTMLTRKVKF